MFGRRKIYSDESEFDPTDNLILQTNKLFVRTVIAISGKKRQRKERDGERKE